MLLVYSAVQLKRPMKKGLNKILALLFLGIVLASGPLAAQKEGAMWYFGHHAGLDFTRHYPKPITDGKIYTREGVASIADKDGNLLFYTDGSNVWNKNHQIMDNGLGLFGNTSSTQSSIIVPTPGKQYEYFIFTVDVIDEAQGGNGLNYSKVDMLLNQRLGRVTEKNQPLQNPCVEKITAVKHDNGIDYWIIAHGWNNNTFFVYKLTSGGVSSTGTFHIQNVGSIHENVGDDNNVNRGAVGYMKSSPKGDFLALAIESKSLFELFTFDNKTGQITFLASLTGLDEGDNANSAFAAYGVEFSPTSNYLYGSTRKGGKLLRWDLKTPTEDKIRKSRELLNAGMNNSLTCGALQLAFNGKIYICFAGQEYLGVINSPTQEECNFVQLGASLIDNTTGVGGQAYYGLPTFLPDFFNSAEFFYENTCVLDQTIFYLSSIFGISGKPSWTFYTQDGSAMVGRAQVDPYTLEGTFTFTEPGTYMAEMRATHFGNELVDRREIYIHSLPELEFQDTTILCAGGTVPLDAGDGAFYRWSDNVNLLERVREIRTAGTYSVEVTHNNGCVKRDTTQVVEKPRPVITEIISTKASCGFNNGTITILPAGNLEDYEFDWKQFPDSTTNRLTNLTRGVYEVDIISKETGCPKTEKITISETGAPDIVINPSVQGTICPGSEIVLTAEGAGNYIWTFPEGDTTASITIRPYETETYVVEGYSTDNQGNRCSGFQDITVEVHPFDPPALGPDLSLCEGQEKQLDGLSRFVSWEWNNGQSGRYVTLTETTPELILVATDRFGCESSDTISIVFKPLPVVDLGEDRTLCKGSAEVTLDAGIADQYLWNTGDTLRQINPQASGSYSVLVTLNGCSSSDDVIVRLNSPDSLRIDSVATRDITCFGAKNGEIRVFARGEGSFYEYSLDEGMTWEDNYGFFENISGGLHTMTIREDSACITSWPGTIEVNEPEPLDIGYKLTSPSCENCSDGQILLQLSGGTPPYDILWSNFETGKSRNNLMLGNYSVSVADSLNCKTVVTIPLEMGHGSLSVPNAFTPNGDGRNDVWKVDALQAYPECIVRIFDQTGRLVFESASGYPEPWNGRLDGTGDYLPTGTYYYVLKLNDFLDLITGSITLIR